MPVITFENKQKNQSFMVSEHNEASNENSSKRWELQKDTNGTGLLVDRNKPRD